MLKKFRLETIFHPLSHEGPDQLQSFAVNRDIRGPKPLHHIKKFLFVPAGKEKLQLAGIARESGRILLHGALTPFFTGL